MKRPTVIAVLDDEPQLRKALRRLLVVHGFAVVTFERGADVLTALAAHPMDCLLLDLRMPEMSGYEVLAGLAERRISTPVIVLSAHGEPDTLGRVRALGAVAYLTKPVDEAALLSAISEAISSESTSWNSNANS